MSKKEIKKKIKEQLWKESKNWSLKDRIKMKIWWRLKSILPVQKSVRDTCKEIKKATKILHTPCPEDEGSLIKDCKHLLNGKCMFLDDHKCFQKD